MSDPKFVSPPKNDSRTNLDHLIISFQSRTGDQTVHALNEFLSDVGRQSNIVRDAWDYDYPMMRRLLAEKLSIDDLAPLYPSGSPLIRITNRASFHDFLARVQRGQIKAPISHIYGLPYVELSAKNTPELQFQPQGPATSDDVIIEIEDDSLPKTPTRPRPTRPRPVAGKSIDAPAAKDPEEDNDKDVNEDNDLTQDEPEADPPNDEEEPRGPDPGDEEPEDEDESTLVMTQLGGRNDTDEEEWKRACEFFRCSVDDKEIFVPGLTLRLLPYQAFGVWRVFIQVAEKRIPSFMLGDAPGLGKTGSE